MDNSLYEALELENVERVKHLLSIGAEKESGGGRSWKASPLLHIACCKGNLELIKVLVSYGIDDFTVRDESGDTPLTAAAEYKQYYCILTTIRMLNLNPNIQNLQGRTVLHYACGDGNIDSVHALIKDHEADLKIRDDYGNTPLMIAAKNKQFQIWESLICDYGCDPNVKGFLGRNLLHFACADGDIKLVNILLQDHKADMSSRDIFNDTPLMTAAKHEQCDVWKSLICDYGCDPNVKGPKGRTLLHLACADGNIDLVHKLVQDYKANLNLKDASNDTPLMVAAKNKQFKVWKSLICDHGCDPNVKGPEGRTLLHFACANNNMDLVHVLIRDHKADLNIRDVFDDTPLMTAAELGQHQVMRSLLSDYGCDPNVKGLNGGTLLHFACADGNIDLVHVLVRDYKANLYAKDNSNDTPLMVAAKYKQYEVVRSLICDYFSDPNVRHLNGRTLLHFACADGNIDLVHVLVRDCKADLNIRDCLDDTPHMTAVKKGKWKVVRSLICDYGCDPNVKGSNGRTLLHFACADGDIDLMHVLVRDHKADLSIRDEFNDTPLMTAAKKGQCKVVRSLICDYGCDPNEKYFDGKTLLHFACTEGNIGFVHVLVQECKADLNVRDDSNNTPLMTAVKRNKHELMKVLISDYKCDVNVTDSDGRSLLHLAGGVEVMRLLIKQFRLSLSIADNDGNTPFHLFSSDGHCNVEFVRVLLFEFHAPVYIRNKAGQTPMDRSKSGQAHSLLTEYLSTHRKLIEADYKSMQLLAVKRYSGSNFVCRLFVVGHPGAGKSSLVEALKREGFFESFSRVSEKSVPPHTAGIVKGYERVQFYDFAGDPKHYSSHAAILERMLLNIGTNICILVLNLVEEDAEIERKYFYWMSFIKTSFNGLTELPSIIVIGSHSDKLPSKDTVSKKKEFIHNLVGKGNVYLSLDCCSPRSDGIKSLCQSICDISKKSEPYILSYKESILLGLLEKDFSNVTACTAQTIANSVEEVGINLPRSVSLLYPILQKLQAIGVLLVVGGKEENSHVVLNVAQLTNEVHKKLFAKDAFLSNRSLASFNIGLLPGSLLQDVLPEYITKECLIQLQYCQEVSHIEIGSDQSVSPSISSSHVPTSLDKSYLFFPALCSLEKDISWQKLPEHTSYTIGWLARCSDPHDFFPPRFLHVLLLRIALRFTLVAYSNEFNSNCSHLKRSCKMWKSGMHWLTEKGVECEVDVKESKEVVVSIQSEENSKSCLAIFNNIINCVMETKAEFCNSIKLEFFLLNELNSLSDDNLYPLERVERVLQCSDTKVVSVCGSQWLDRFKLVHIHSTLWESLFLIDEHSVLKYLEDIVREWHELGINLELPSHVLEGIETDHFRDVHRCKVKMVSTWLGSSLHYPPCWWSLVKALKETGAGKIACAEDIIKDKGEHIALQEKLLNTQHSHLTPDKDFLESFAGVVGSKWPYLASLLSLTSSTIEEVRREGEGLTQRDHALLMLHKWVSMGEATYGQLYQKLKPVSLLNYC